MNRLYEIDVLRISGALIVMMYHYTFRGSIIDGERIPLFPAIEIVTKYGYLGIGLFFMISGFVILFSALNKSPFEFVISRIDRLYPVYWVAVSITTIIIVLFTDNIISPFLYLTNLTMVHAYVNIPSIDPIYWTLHVELKFYFLVFILMLFGQIHKYRVWLPVWLLITLIYTFTNQPFFMGWFISPAYSSFFISGILFYLIYVKGVNYHRLSLIGVSLFVSVYNTINNIGGFIVNAGTKDKVVASLLIILLHGLFLAIATRKFTIKGSTILVVASGMTYPVYLLHTRLGKTLFDLLFQDMSKYVALTIVISFVIVLSFLVYTYIDKRVSGYIKINLSKIFPKQLLLWGRSDYR